jgi:uncharacterized protein (TIGR00251 family)
LENPAAASTMAAVMEWIQQTADGVIVSVRAVPRASKNAIQGVHDGALKIRLTTPPIDGKANQALIKYLSKTLKVSKSQIELMQGETARNKAFRITGIPKEELIRKIEEVME